jgi:GAF domain-containing protein
MQANLPFRKLEEVHITDQLRKRAAGRVDSRAVEDGIIRLTRQMAEAPDQVLDRLAEAALGLCRAHTVGISILEEEGDRELFRWGALAGQLCAEKGRRLPRDPSPCGMALDRRESLLFSYPESHFTFPGLVDPPIVEVLLTPIYNESVPVGTMWVMSHEEGRRFDRADLRVVNELGRFASSAYAVLASLGYVEPRRSGEGMQPRQNL